MPGSTLLISNLGDTGHIVPSSAVTIVDNCSSNDNKSSIADPNEPQEPYSIFTKPQKIMIVFICAVSCFFSPFSTNVYFPALLTIQTDLQVTEQLVNLTVTLYMIIQGISPSFWSSFSDYYGRRPVYIMTFFIYILASIGLGCTKNYTTLLTLRMLQAVGSSAGVSVGAGSIGDIASPSERGGYMGIYSMGSMIGPMIGPVLGGAISHELGWRWIFWISAFMATPLWLVHIFVLPETLRKLVGNGSGYANPTPLQYWRHRKRVQKDAEKNVLEDKSNSNIQSEGTAVCNDSRTDNCMKIISGSKTAEKNSSNQKTHVQKSKSFPNPLASLCYFKEKDIAIVLFYYSLQYTGLYCVLTTLTELFSDIYKLNDLQIGLCFLSNGLGSAIGSFSSGKLLDWRYKKTAESLNIDEHKTKRGNLDPSFPIEKARLGMTWVWGIIFNVALIAYGWCISYRVPIAIPIAINFLLSYCSTSTFTAVHTLLVDLFPKNSAAIMASNNISKCVSSAILIMSCAPGINALGAGWYFTIVSLILFVSRVSMVIELRYGPQWRLERLEREKKMELEEMQRDSESMRTANGGT